MADEDMTMDRALEFAKSAEGRNDILNDILRRSEILARCRRLIKELDEIQYNTITPSKLANMQATTPDLKVICDMVGDILQQSALMLDDEEAIKTVIRLAIENKED